ncbi:hypothetical protein F5Y18DRAFT_411101 [Xylariaceae sp. FL1019]|nr:hypothetical protein F5Y18DRAFT_411101 [Xylariaceae sp. FL1019]
MHILSNCLRATLRARVSVVPRLPQTWRTRMSTKGATPSMAVLDDYLNIAGQHFDHIPSSELSVDIFNEALPSFINATASQQESIVEKLRPYTIISSMRERTSFPAELLRALPNLRLLLATGTQFETFDLNVAKDLGIHVVAAPGRGRADGKIASFAGRPIRPKLDIRHGGGHPTTQHTWSLILALARNVAFDDAAMKDPTRKAAWQSRLAVGMSGATLGVMGLGRLGAAVARIGALAFGMRVICWSANLTQERADAKAIELGLPARGGGGAYPLEADEPTFRAVSKEELFRQSDVLSLHYVLGERSKGIVGKDELAIMKDSALLVNTSRGPLIDENGLYEALLRGTIRGAALDVFDVEPLPASSRWRSTEWGTGEKGSLIITPHMGYAEEGIMHTWYEETAENLERWLRGDERSCVFSVQL